MGLAPGDLSDEERENLERKFAEAEDGSYYDLLELDYDADAAAVQKAYYGLSRVWHPDRFFRRDLGGYGEMLETVFVSITQGYRTLTDPVKRRTYDRKLDRTATKKARDEGVERARETAVKARGAGEEAEKATGGKRRRAASARRPGGRAAGPVDPRRRRRYQQRAVSGVRKQLRERLAKAQRFFLAGKEAMDEGNAVKAASSLQLALQLNPNNADYKALANEAAAACRQVQAAQLAAAAENAESFHNIREAMANYHKAVDEYGSKDPRAHFRLGKLVRRYEEDDRAALGYLRKAVQLAPDEVAFRLELGNLYADLGLGLNAQREFQAVLERDKNNEEAKAGMKRSRS